MSMQDEVTPKISVIIPVKNDAERLRVCLNALSRQTFAGPSEILVVDNGSDRQPEEVVADYPDARLLSERMAGSYAARNLGAREAQGAVLAFVDSDCIPAPEWLERGYARCVREGNTCFIAGSVRLFPQDPHNLTMAEQYELINAFPQERYVSEMHFGATANLFVTRPTFEAVGPFDGALLSSGDWEWGRRAYAQGVEPIYDPGVVVSHPARRSWSELRAKSRRVQRGHAQLGQQRVTVWTVAKGLARLVDLRPLPRLVMAEKHSSLTTAKRRALYAAFVVALDYSRRVDSIRVDLEYLRRRV